MRMLLVASVAAVALVSTAATSAFAQDNSFRRNRILRQQPVAQKFQQSQSQFRLRQVGPAAQNPQRAQFIQTAPVQPRGEKLRLQQLAPVQPVVDKGGPPAKIFSRPVGPGVDGVKQAGAQPFIIPKQPVGDTVRLRPVSPAQPTGGTARLRPVPPAQPIVVAKGGGQAQRQIVPVAADPEAPAPIQGGGPDTKSAELGAKELVTQQPVAEQPAAAAPADVTGDIAADTAGAAPQPKIEAPAVAQEKAAPVEIPQVVAPVRKLVKKPKAVVRYYEEDDSDYGDVSYAPRSYGYSDGCN